MLGYDYDVCDCKMVQSVAVTSLQSCPALVLNADFRPLSYFPLSLWHWQDAVRAVFLDRVDVIAEYSREIGSPSFRMKLPSVIAMRQYVKPQPYAPFTRFNVYLRDSFCCQYCGKPFHTSKLTFDHVVPRSRGGHCAWDNIVAACGGCNVRKGNRLPNESGMFPRKKPFRPTTFFLEQQGRHIRYPQVHQTWLDYLYWDSELLPDVANQTPTLDTTDLSIDKWPHSAAVILNQDN